MRYVLLLVCYVVVVVVVVVVVMAELCSAIEFKAHSGS